MNGHTHALTHYTVDGKGEYVTSGAGSLVLSHDQLGGTPLKDRTMHKANDMHTDTLASVPFGANLTAGKSVNTVAVAGVC